MAWIDAGDQAKSTQRWVLLEEISRHSFVTVLSIHPCAGGRGEDEASPMPVRAGR